METIHLVKNSLHYYHEMYCGVEFSWWEVPAENPKGVWMDTRTRVWYTEDVDKCTCLGCIQFEAVK